MSDASDVLRVANSNELRIGRFFGACENATLANGRRVSKYFYLDGSYIIEAQEKWEFSDAGAAEMLREVHEECGAGFVEAYIRAAKPLEFKFDGGIGYTFDDGSFVKKFPALFEAVDAGGTNENS